MKNKFQKSITCFALVLAMVITPFTVSAGSIDGSINDDAIVTHKDVQITDALSEAIRTADADDLIDVAMWMVDINYTDIEKDVNSSIFGSNTAQDNVGNELMQMYIETYRSNLKTAYTVANADRIANLENLCGSFEETFVSSYAPMAIVSLTKDQIAKVAVTSGNVKVLDLFENIQFEPESDVANASSGATVVRDSLGYTGSGIKLGMIEPGNPLALTSYNGLFNTSKIHIVSSFSGNDYLDNIHATRVAAIMVGKGTTYNGVSYKGIAPDAELYCVQGCNEAQIYANIEVLLDYGVNAINMSMGADGQTSYTVMNLWMDHIAYVEDVHLVKSAGNSGGTISYPGLSCNIVTVGAYTDNNNTLNYQGPATINAQDLNSNNYQIAYYSSYSHGNAGLAKPDLIASGSNIVYANIPNSYYDSANGRTIDLNDGTSFSAPQVTAVMAQLMQANSSLIKKQDQMKAILCSSAIYRVEDDLEETNAGDANMYGKKQGAGILNAWLARYIATSGKSESIYMYGNTATIYTYYMTATSSDIYLRFALTWLKRSTNDTAPTSGHYNTASLADLANYDITITTPRGDVVTNKSVKGNLEVMQLNTSIYGYGTYTVKIQINTANNITNYLGFAWY